VGVNAQVSLSDVANIAVSEAESLLAEALRNKTTELSTARTNLKNLRQKFEELAHSIAKNTFANNAPMVPASVTGAAVNFKLGAPEYMVDNLGGWNPRKIFRVSVSYELNITSAEGWARVTNTMTLEREQDFPVGSPQAQPLVDAYNNIEDLVKRIDALQQEHDELFTRRSQLPVLERQARAEIARGILQTSGDDVTVRALEAFRTSKNVSRILGVLPSAD
jgi:hypothetical protein